MCHHQSTEVFPSSLSPLSAGKAQSYCYITNRFIAERRGIKTTNNLDTTDVKLKEIINLQKLGIYYCNLPCFKEYSPILLKGPPKRWTMFPDHNLRYAKMFCSFDEGHVVGLPTCTWTGILFPVSCHPMIILSVTPAEILPIIRQIPPPWPAITVKGALTLSSWYLSRP